MGIYKCSILIVDDDPQVLASLSALLSKDFEVLAAVSARSALELFQRRDIDLILADQRLPEINGIQVLEWVREHSSKTVRLLMTGFANFEEAITAVNTGRASRYLVKPWRTEELMDVLRDAARTFLLEQSHEQLLQELRRLNLELEERVQQRTQELEDANRELQQKNQMLEKLALTDSLTGLPNRRAMDRLAKTELRRRQRHSSFMALGLVDADHFKAINARYLLSGGDRVLVELGKVLSASLRTIDTVGRIGGEEFEVVAPETNLQGAVVLGERIRKAVESSSIQYQGETIRVTVSVGFTVVAPTVQIDHEQVKHLAAAALAEAKNAGRNRCVVKTVGSEQ